MKGFILFGLFFLFLHNLGAQPYSVYTNNDGLSKNTVQSILKDSRGFMWFGTSVGLNRFDGYNFVNYYHVENDTTSICNNNIRKILEDANGNFWIATTNGLSRYNYDLDNFTNFYHHPENSFTVSNNYINGIYIDKDNSLWLATSEGFDKYIAKTNTFQRFVCGITENGVFKNKAVYDITQDSKGLFWLCTEGNGIVSFSEETRQFLQFTGKDEITPIGNTINGKWFAKNENNILTIVSENGFFDFNIQTKQFSITAPATKNSKLKDIEYNPLTDVYKGGESSMWIKVSNKGVVLYDSTRSQFESYSSINSNYGLIDNSVLAMKEDPTGKIFIATSKGICSFDPQTKTFTNRKNSANKIYGIEKPVTALCFDKNNNFWIGTTSGLYLYNSTLNTLKLYNHRFQDSSSLILDYINSIYEDKKGNIWVGAGGLNLYNKSKDNFTQFRPSKNSTKTVNSQYIIGFYEDNKENLWISTWAGGINIFHPSTQEFSYITTSNNPDGLLKSDDVVSITEDSKGFLWITSNNGLTRFNQHTKQLKWYSTSDGLVNNIISDVLEDNNGNLWISTGKGMSMLNMETQTFKSFDVSDGLQGDEFTFNTALKASDGKLYFGGTDGFSIIDPENLRQNTIEPVVRITDFQIFNKSVGIGEKINGKVILAENIVDTKSIVLTHKESVLSFEFAALHFTNPEKNQYAYMLDGVDDDWNYTGANRRYATYTTLNPGKYLFQVKASNGDGLWSSNITAIELTILPPWWLTIWFKIGLGIFVIGLIQAFYFLQLHSIRKSKKRLELLVSAQTKDLEQAISQLVTQKTNLQDLNTTLEIHQKEIELQKEEISQRNSNLIAKNKEILEISQRIHDNDQLKLRYFTNISHEFRTPITLIVNPLNKLLESENLDKKHIDQLSIIGNSANRLLRLVNQLLDIGKFESGTMAVKNEIGDFVKFAESIVASFKGQANERNINLKFETILTDLNIAFDWDKMENILFNLLSNSFKFVPDNGTVTMLLAVDDYNISIKISDTGIGIPKDKINKIFEPFYQVDSSNTRFHEGSGIGLYHTQELVTLLNGSILVNSEEGKGTTVEVIFPYEISVFSPVEKSTSNEIPLADTQLIVDADSSRMTIAQALTERNPILLIVEDNLELRDYIISEFKHSYTVMEAANGKQGMDMIYKCNPDLIISDIMMPEMDGIELCKRIKQDDQISHIPIILLTAKADKDDIISGIEIGADEYITKPFNIKHLIAKADQLLQSRRKLKEKFSKDIYFEPSNMAFTNADKRFLKKLILILEENMDNENFQVSDIAKQIGMGKTNLYKKVFALTNQSVAEFVRTIKLRNAAKLLLTMEYSVSEVAFKVGFKDPSHFIKSFSRHYNLTPKRFVEEKIQMKL